jgi:hypothetical protein
MLAEVAAFSIATIFEDAGFNSAAVVGFSAVVIFFISNGNVPLVVGLAIRLMIVSWLTTGSPAPVLRDETEQVVLDLVPLARPRRKVAHNQRNPQLIGQFLQASFPQTRTRPVAPAAHRQ